VQRGAERQDLVVEVVAAVVQEGCPRAALADAQVGAGFFCSMKEKSSAPMLGSMSRSTFSGPTSDSATSAANIASGAVLMVAG
jgi:hypothetical protein